MNQQPMHNKPMFNPQIFSPTKTTQSSHDHSSQSTANNMEQQEDDDNIIVISDSDDDNDSDSGDDSDGSDDDMELDDNEAQTDALSEAEKKWNEEKAEEKRLQRKGIFKRTDGKTVVFKTQRLKKMKKADLNTPTESAKTWRRRLRAKLAKKLKGKTQQEAEKILIKARKRELRKRDTKLKKTLRGQGLLPNPDRPEWFNGPPRVTRQSVAQAKKIPVPKADALTEKLIAEYNIDKFDPDFDALLASAFQDYNNKLAFQKKQEVENRILIQQERVQQQQREAINRRTRKQAKMSKQARKRHRRKERERLKAEQERVALGSSGIDLAPITPSHDNPYEPPPLNPNNPNSFAVKQGPLPTAEEMANVFESDPAMKSVEPTARSKLKNLMSEIEVFNLTKAPSFAKENMAKIKLASMTSDDFLSQLNSLDTLQSTLVDDPQSDIAGVPREQFTIVLDDSESESESESESDDDDPSPEKPQRHKHHQKQKQKQKPPQMDSMDVEVSTSKQPPPTTTTTTPTPETEDAMPTQLVTTASVSEPPAPSAPPKTTAPTSTKTSNKKKEIERLKLQLQQKELEKKIAEQKAKLLAKQQQLKEQKQKEAMVKKKAPNKAKAQQESKTQATATGSTTTTTTTRTTSSSSVPSSSTSSDPEPTVKPISKETERAPKPDTTSKEATESTKKRKQPDTEQPEITQPDPMPKKPIEPVETVVESSTVSKKRKTVHIAQKPKPKPKSKSAGTGVTNRQFLQAWTQLQQKVADNSRTEATLKKRLADLERQKQQTVKMIAAAARDKKELMKAIVALKQPHAMMANLGQNAMEQDDDTMLQLHPSMSMDIESNAVLHRVQRKEWGAEKFAMVNTSNSTLRMLHSFRLNEQFDQGWGYNPLSIRFSTKIDPMVPICPFDLDGICNDSECKFQHFRDMQMSEADLAADLLEYIIDPKLRSDIKTDWNRSKDINQLIRSVRDATKYGLPHFYLDRNRDQSTTTTTTTTSSASSSLPSSKVSFRKKIIKSTNRNKKSKASSLTTRKTNRPTASQLMETEGVLSSSSSSSSSSSLQPAIDVIKSLDMSGVSYIHLTQDETVEDADDTEMLSTEQRYYIRQRTISEYRQDLKEDPNNVALWIEFANEFLRNGKRKDDRDSDNEFYHSPGMAASILSRGIEKNRNDEQLWLRGLCVFGHIKKDRDEVIDTAKDALSCIPHSRQLLHLTVDLIASPKSKLDFVMSELDRDQSHPDHIVVQLILMAAEIHVTRGTTGECIEWLDERISKLLDNATDGVDTFLASLPLWATFIWLTATGNVPLMQIEGDHVSMPVVQWEDVDVSQIQPVCDLFEKMIQSAVNIGVDLNHDNMSWFWDNWMQCLMTMDKDGQLCVQTVHRMNEEWKIARASGLLACCDPESFELTEPQTDNPGPDDVDWHMWFQYLRVVPSADRDRVTNLVNDLFDISNEDRTEQRAIECFEYLLDISTDRIHIDHRLAGKPRGRHQAYLWLVYFEYMLMGDALTSTAAQVSLFDQISVGLETTGAKQCMLLLWNRFVEHMMAKQEMRVAKQLIDRCFQEFNLEDETARVNRAYFDFEGTLDVDVMDVNTQLQYRNCGRECDWWQVLHRDVVVRFVQGIEMAERHTVVYNAVQKYPSNVLMCLSCIECELDWDQALAGKQLLFLALQQEAYCRDYWKW
eukprot:TRINITY_DN2228_c0_g2_i1.p1 TRINITY_DN2228_c0_g2~~TRINITY_DN2228_c0_g2_i1.p1  ORF type:complete len:1818 (+),score=633.62 TRINITY_DN2228_c0_g2_i1:448-5454(+)